MFYFVALILEMSVIALSVWQTVGIWRSAEHHKEKTNRKFIATLAQIIICITVLVSYGKIVGLKTYYNDVFWNALGKDPLGEYHLKISDDERTLTIGGQSYTLVKDPLLGNRMELSDGKPTEKRTALPPV